MVNLGIIYDVFINVYCGKKGMLEDQVAAAQRNLQAAQQALQDQSFPPEKDEEQSVKLISRFEEIEERQISSEIPSSTLTLADFQPLNFKSEIDMTCSELPSPADLELHSQLLEQQRLVSLRDEEIALKSAEMLARSAENETLRMEHSLGRERISRSVESRVRATEISWRRKVANMTLDYRRELKIVEDCAIRRKEREEILKLEKEEWLKEKDKLERKVVAAEKASESREEREAWLEAREDAFVKEKESFVKQKEAEFEKLKEKQARRIEEFSADCDATLEAKKHELEKRKEEVEAAEGFLEKRQTRLDKLEEKLDEKGKMLEINESSASRDLAERLQKTEEQIKQRQTELEEKEKGLLGREEELESQVKNVERKVRNLEGEKQTVEKKTKDLEGREQKLHEKETEVGPKFLIKM